MLAGCFIPVVWAHLDGLACAMVDEDWRHLAERSMYVLSRWLCELPIFFALAFPLMWNLRDRRATLCADVAVNVLCMVLPLPVYYGMYILGEYLRQIWGVFGMLIKVARALGDRVEWLCSSLRRHRIFVVMLFFLPLPPKDEAVRGGFHAHDWL
eukprot:s261_g5.t1